MNTVTYDQVIAMNPCWLETPAARGAAGEAERAWQITELTNMLQEAD